MLVKGVPAYVNHWPSMMIFFTTVYAIRSPINMYIITLPLKYQSRILSHFMNNLGHIAEVVYDKLFGILYSTLPPGQACVAV